MQGTCTKDSSEMRSILCASYFGNPDFQTLRILRITKCILVFGGTSTRGPCVRGVFEHVQPPPCSKSIRSPEHPCPNHNNVRVLRAYAHQSIHALSLCFKPQVTLGKWYFYLFYSSRKIRFFLLSKCAFRCSETLKIAQNVDPSQCFRPSPK